MFFTVITHIKNSVIMSFKYKLFKEMFKMSSAAAQKASTKSFQIFSIFAVVDPNQPNPTRPNPWVNPTHGQLWSDWESTRRLRHHDSTYVTVTLY